MPGRAQVRSSEVQAEFDELLADYQRRRAWEQLRMHMESRCVEARDVLRKKIVAAKTLEEVDAIFEAVKAIGKDGQP